MGGRVLASGARLAPLTIADAVARVLRETGITHVFGMPGGGSTTDLVEALQNVEIEFVLCHTETAAGFAAATYGELTGTPGVFLTALGPGLAAGCNAVAHAYLDRDPVLMLTDCHPRAANGLEHQRIDHHAILGPITKWSTSLSPDDPTAVVASALALAGAGQPGPVHIDMAPDVSSMPIAPISGLPLPPVVGTRSGALADSLTPFGTASALPTTAKSAIITRLNADSQCTAADAEAALSLLRHAERPVVLVGLGVRGADAAAATRGFAERYRLPVLTTYKGKGAFPDNHPLHAGVLTGGTLEQSTIEQADLIVCIGMDPVELIPRPWPYLPPVLYIGPWPHNERHFGAASLIGQIAPALETLGDGLQRSYAWDLADVRARKLAQLQGLRVTTSTGIAPHRLVEIAREHTPGEPIVSVDAGAHMFAATNFWQTSRPNGFLISNGLASMGYALPAAIAAALLHPAEKVIAFTGDGGLLMCAAEIETAVRLNLNIIIALFDDQALSLIKIKQDQKGFEPTGVLLGAIDWSRLGESFGCEVLAAADEAGLAGAWRVAMEHRGPVLIDARVDPSGYRTMLEALRS